MEPWESMLRGFIGADAQMTQADLIQLSEKELEHLAVTLKGIREVIPMIDRACHELQDTIESSLRELKREDLQRFNEALERRCPHD